MRFARDSALYDWYGLNDALFLLLNGFHETWFDRFMQAVTSLGHPALYPFYIALALCWSLARPASLPLRNVAVFAVAYVSVSVILVPVLKGALDFPRPAALLGGLAVIVGDPDAAQSFPSGHAAFAVALAASLGAGLGRMTRRVLATFALTVCVSRVCVGAHFPADVVAGALLALATVALVQVVMPARAPA